MRIILAYITALLTAFAASGHLPADTAKVYFRVGQSQPDPSFADNRHVLEGFERALTASIADNTLDSLVIKTYSSPDGNNASNLTLSDRRCEHLAARLLEATGMSPEFIRPRPQGVAWDELRDLVQGNTDVPYRKEVLDILTETPLWIKGEGGKMTEGRKKRLMDLEGGAPYRWIQKNLFPELRKGVAVAYYNIPAARSTESHGHAEQPYDARVVEAVSDEQIPLITAIADSVSDSIPPVPEIPEAAADTLKPMVPGRFQMAVKTNMLFDALLVPNIGVEFRLDRHVSVYAEWMYAWWDSYPRHRFWRIYGGDLGIRWWFGRRKDPRPLSGHHLGIYGGILTFDFELGDYGYMGGKPKGTLWDRFMVDAGIEYGFSLPVAKRINIDFSIGVGYLGGRYIKYYPFDNDYYFDKEYNMHYFGPTKAEVSLVWLIGKGVAKKQKGGDE